MAGVSAKIVDSDNETKLLNEWEATGYRQLTETRMYDPQHRQFINAGDTLPRELTLSAAILIFLSTLSGQSKQTHKTYRVGCRRLMWFIHATDRGLPSQLPIFEMSPSVLEDFYLWLVETYGKQNRATIGAYMASARNLFDYLSSRELTPGGVQYSKMIARLGKMQGRASYKTPATLRIKGRQAQIEQVAQLAFVRQPVTPAAVPVEPTVQTDPGPEPAPEQATTPASEELPETSPKPARAKRVAHDPVEIKRQQMEELRDRAIILTLFTTGMRRDEVTRLERTELESLITEWQNATEPAEPDERRVYELIITGKGQKERVVYFDEVTLDAIKQYLGLRGKDSYRPLFLQHHRGRAKVAPGVGGENYRVGDRTIWVTVKKYAAQLGIQLKPHDFRHNLATTLLNAGAQLSEVQDILGHASPTTTKQIYAHYDKGHLKQAFARFGKSAGPTSNKPG